MRRTRRRHSKSGLLADVLIAVVWFAFWAYVACRFFYVIAAPAPADVRIRDGVHTPAFTALATIDRNELADMRAAEEWTEPVVTPVTVNVGENYTISEEIAENVENFSTNTTSGFTDRERYLLLHIMVHEAGNQGVIGQALVGRVVLNRVESGRFPDSIEAVLFQPGQFGPEAEICRYEPNADSYAALELLESGWDESQGALFFCTTSFSWATYLFTHGGHNFYA